MKERLDVLMMQEGYAQSREKAKAIIMSGCVFVNGQREDKAGSMFDPAKARLEVKGHTLKYVSRGGLKLEKAMTAFGISLKGLVCMDIGASTGGFTDCMLQNGAEKVYAIDVGHGQLAWSLRTDERVVCMEKTNFRYLTPDDLEDRPDFASVDVSFISLSKILLPARRLLKDEGSIVCLIKPQFEAGKEKVGKKGVVREAAVQKEVIGKIYTLADLLGYIPCGLDFSPIKGPEGNIEFLLYLKKDETRQEELADCTEALTEALLLEKTDGQTGLGDSSRIKEIISETVENAHLSL